MFKKHILYLHVICITCIYLPYQSLALDIDISARVLGCGDNVIDIGELCDGSAMSATCQSLGFTSGTVSCTNTCTFNTSLCVLSPTPSGGGGGSSGGGGGGSFSSFVNNTNSTSSQNASPNTGSSSLSINNNSSNPNGENDGFVIVPAIAPKENQLQCSDSILLDKPVRVNIFAINNKKDVMQLQRFLNTYEGKNLAVDGVYKKNDILAVIQWQERYSNTVLKPWGLKKGTGYVYITSMQQMKKQHVSMCAKSTINKTELATSSKVKIVCPYFKNYYNTGAKKDIEIEKIQKFLNTEVQSDLVVDGVYDFTTKQAVKTFQKKYANQILRLWGLNIPSGWWYASTIKKANEIVGCTK